MSMSEAGGPTNPQEAGDAAFLRPVVVAIHAVPWGQTDLELIVEKILNRSDPGATTRRPLRSTGSILFGTEFAPQVV